MSLLRKVLFLGLCFCSYFPLYAQKTCIQNCMDHPYRAATICSHKMQWFVEDCATSIECLMSRLSTVMLKMYFVLKRSMCGVVHTGILICSYTIMSPFIILKESGYLIRG